MDENVENNVESDDFEPEVTAGETSTSRSGFWKVCSCFFFLSSAVLGFLLNDISTELQSTERKLSNSRREVSTLEIENRDISDQLDRASRELKSVNSSLSRVEASLNEVESALDLSFTSGRKLSDQIDDLVGELNECRYQLRSSRSEVSQWQSQAYELEEDLQDCVDIANERQRKINSAISTANNGVRYLTDIPSGGFYSSFGDPYESLRRKYNDLVDRFNAAVDRSNELARLLSRALGELD